MSNTKRKHTICGGSVTVYKWPYADEYHCEKCGKPVPRHEVEEEKIKKEKNNGK